MVAYKHITKLISVIVAAAVVVCVLALMFPERVAETFGEGGVALRYEAELFDTSRIMEIDTQMDEEQWSDMLANAAQEEYYSCDVVIGGETIYNVGIRPKGNTSLSNIVMDPETDRYSFKMEFDRYVDGQTCFGLDKLVLNNNYADATNMKEALVYDMYRYLDVDASLYNYAKISVNGEYWGVYLALEAVEDSFQLRNYGTADGNLYKPESMGIGGGRGGDGGGFGGEGGPGRDGGGPGREGNGFGRDGGNFGGEGDSSGKPEMPPEEIGAQLDGVEQTSVRELEQAAKEDTRHPEQAADGEQATEQDSQQVSERQWEQTPDERDEAVMPGREEEPMPDGESEARSELKSGAAPGHDSELAPGSDSESIPDRDSEPVSEEEGMPGGRAGRPDREGMPGRGPSMGGSGGDLNYTDDDLDSYSTIWEGEVNNTGKKDHRRVVAALKNISEGNDLEQYMDVDNILKYMAVHVFSVNLDSLSGAMAHNYYLYEDSGQLNILPWDYNLSFGGMGMGRSSGASGTVNDAIDTPFDATRFFDGLLEDEEYLARYHEYLEQLVEAYVFGGKFDEFYNRVRSQIDTLVETDPTAFYSLEEYLTGVEMLYDTVMLRAESIRGQLDGSIPSTDEGQQADPSGLIDASSIDIDAMGTMGGNRSFGPGREGFREEAEPVMPEGEGGFPGEPPSEGMPKPQAAEAFARGGMPGEPESRNSEAIVGNLAVWGSCLLISVLALILAAFYERIPRRK